MRYTIDNYMSERGSIDFAALDPKFTEGDQLTVDGLEFYKEDAAVAEVIDLYLAALNDAVPQSAPAAPAQPATPTQDEPAASYPKNLAQFIRWLKGSGKVWVAWTTDEPGTERVVEKATEKRIVTSYIEKGDAITSTMFINPGDAQYWSFKEDRAVYDNPVLFEYVEYRYGPVSTVSIPHATAQPATPPQDEPTSDKNIVTDDVGKPLTVYHGGKSVLRQCSGVMYWTTDRKFAESYSEVRHGQSEPKITVAHIRITKPAPFSVVESVAKNLGHDTEQASQAEIVEWDGVAEGLRNMGYDGAKLNDFGFLSDFDEEEVYVVLNAENQVSLINNGRWSGNFDGMGPDHKGPAATYTLTTAPHPKFGTVYVAVPVQRVSKEAFKAETERAKTHKGWYSSFNKGGAVAGYQFKSKEHAEAFAGDVLSEPVAPAQQPPRDLLKEAREYFIGQGMIEQMTTDKAHYTRALLDGIPDRTRTDLVNEAINYFAVQGFIDELNTDGRIYIQAMIDAAKAKPDERGMEYGKKPAEKTTKSGKPIERSAGRKEAKKKPEPAKPAPAQTAQASGTYFERIGPIVQRLSEMDDDTPKDKLLGIAQDIHEHRKGFVQANDNAKVAKKILDPTVDNIMRWATAPGRYDLRGIDVAADHEATATARPDRGGILKRIFRR